MGIVRNVCVLRDTWARRCLVILLTGLALSHPTLAYILSADVILARVARERSHLAFQSLSARGQYQAGNLQAVRFQEWVKQGNGRRLEFEVQNGLTTRLSIGNKTWQFGSSNTSSQPFESLHNFWQIFLVESARDPSATRALQFLRDMGIERGTVSLARFADRVVYVIGARPDDLARPQLWIDKDFWVPVRLILRDAKLGNIDVQLFDYHSPLVDRVYPRRVEIRQNGQLLEVFRYDALTLNTPVAADRFRRPGL